MPDLKATSPAEGLLPLTIGTCQLEEAEMGPLTVLTPFGEGIKGALKKAHGLDWPAPGQSTAAGEGVHAVWFGMDEVMLMGAAPDASLAKAGAVVDQSDAWCAVTLSGEGAEAVLARLVTVDMRAARFPVGATVRSPVFHLPASITRVDAQAFLILTFRSMAATLVHDLEQAMEGVAARG